MVHGSVSGLPTVGDDVAARRLKDLRELFLRLFGPEDLRMFVHDVFGPGEFARLPTGLALEPQVFDLVLRLDRLGRIDERLFLELAGRAPGWRPRISAVAASWGYCTLVHGLHLLEQLHDALVDDGDVATAVSIMHANFARIFADHMHVDRKLSFQVRHASPADGTLTFVRREYSRRYHTTRWGERSEEWELMRSEMECYKLLPLHYDLGAFARRVASYAKTGPAGLQAIVRREMNVADGTDSAVILSSFMGDRRSLSRGWDVLWRSAQRALRPDIHVATLQSLLGTLAKRVLGYNGELPRAARLAKFVNGEP